MSQVAIALGSNLGERDKNLRQAIARLKEMTEIENFRHSQFYETQAVGGPTQKSFLNAAATFRTSLRASALFLRLKKIEGSLGRKPSVRWGPRNIDLDLLMFDRETLSNSVLQIPHPRMLQRRFVLEPLAEIASDWIHPRSGRCIVDHLHDLS